MDVMTNKTRKNYNYTSRYATIPYYYHSVDKKYVYGISRHLANDTDYVIHTITDTDDLDKLALKYYGSPDLYWVIADYNRISDPYIKLADRYNYLYIPSLSGIRWQ